MAYISKDLRNQLDEDAGGLCGYCQTNQQNSGFRLQVEHLIPTAKGGLTVRENLWLACSSCNLRKSDREMVLDPESGVLVEFFNPRLQQWKDHFEWDDSGTVVVGLTEVGRATVKALEMNDTLLVEARKLWVRFGGHPPS